MSTAAPAVQASSEPNVRRLQDWLMLAAACLTALSVPLAVTAPSVALSSMSRELAGGPLALAWVVNGYLLTFGSLALPAGSLADLHGRRRTWLVGLAAFTAATSLAPLSPSLLWMDAARLAQGACAAVALTASSSTLAQRFSAREGAWAFSLIGTSFGVSLAFGPLLAGWLIDVAGWRSLFHVTAGLTLGAALLLLGTRETPRVRSEAGVDVPGAILFTAAVSAFTWAVLQAPATGWSSASCLVPLAASVGLLAAFALWQGQARHPMMDLSLLRRREFLGVQCLALALAFVYIVPIFLLPARFIGIDGDTSLAAGLRMLALSAPLLVVPALTGRLRRRIPVAHIACTGLALAALGLLACVHAGGGPASDIGWPGLLLVGIGIGLPWGVVDGLAVAVVPADRAGMAAGLFNTVRITADGVAVACAAALLSSRLEAGFRQRFHLADAPARALARAVSSGGAEHAAGTLARIGRPVEAQVYDLAFRETFTALAAFAAISAVTVFLLLRSPRQRL